MTYTTAIILLVIILFLLAHPLKKLYLYCEGDQAQAVQSPSLETSQTWLDIVLGNLLQVALPAWTGGWTRWPWSPFPTSAILWFCEFLCSYAYIDDNRLSIFPWRKKITGGQVGTVEIQEGSWPWSQGKCPYSCWAGASWDIYMGAKSRSKGEFLCLWLWAVQHWWIKLSQMKDFPPFHMEALTPNLQKIHSPVLFVTAQLL